MLSLNVKLVKVLANLIRYTKFVTEHVASIPTPTAIVVCLYLTKYFNFSWREELGHRGFNLHFKNFLQCHPEEILQTYVGRFQSSLFLHKKGEEK